jgi:hypothetical protein
MASSWTGIWLFHVSLIFRPFAASPIAGANPARRLRDTCAFEATGRESATAATASIAILRIVDSLL